jgi:aspartyl-tRNA(Asn)/glutamyl-tRNA(Gln) amidotransferase subunit A
MKKITELTVSELCEKLQSREISSAEVTGAYLNQIKESDPQIGAYLTLTEEAAMRRAKQADQALAAGGCRPLRACPSPPRINLCTLGVRTTCASRMLENFVPPYSATVMEKLDAGARSALASSTWTNSPWAQPTRTAPFIRS